MTKGKLTGKEMTGVLLLIAVVLRSDLGREILQRSHKHNFDEDWLIRDWTMMVETLLEWEVFLKLERFDKRLVNRLNRKHRYIMYLVKKVMARVKGNGMKFPKFHMILHYYEDMLMFGPPSCFDTGSNESHHKETKASAKNTQKNPKEFEKQIAKREDELHMLDLALQEIEGRPLWEYYQGYWHPEEPAKEEAEPWTGGTRIKVAREEDGEAVWWFPGQRTKRKVKDLVMDEMALDDDLDAPEPYDGRRESHWDAGVVEYLANLQDELQDYSTRELLVLCEHKRKGSTFRAHPNYRGKGYWNDWVLIDWGAHGTLPCEIWCFIDLREALDDGVSLEISGCIIQRGVYALVESSRYVEDPVQVAMSDLFIPIEKEVEGFDLDGGVERRFYLADVEAIVDPVAVVPNVGSMNRCSYFQVKSRTGWSANFVEWALAPHAHDVIADDDVVLAQE
jgi:hypothetical protein